jgi:RNA polymerase sigma-70 factor (ECF subfamily)
MWLLGIARRRVALYYRRRAAGSTRSSGVLSGEEPDDGAHSVLPEDVLEQLERASVVRAAMLAVPEDRRKALQWKYGEGLSVEVIAARLGKTAKAVESLLSRAREQLRDLLRGYVTTREDRRPVAKESSHD